jgi:hypothetical protein
MKKTCYAIAACALLGTAPLAAAAETFVGILSEATEGVHLTPPSLGTGAALVTLDVAASTLRVETIFFNLTGATTNAHIHCCTGTPFAGFAGVATTTPTFPGFPSGVRLGSYDQTFDMTLPSSWNPTFINNNGGTTSSAFDVLVAGMRNGEAYLNIHTSAVPGGEIRAFLAAPVPEPETYALMLAGLGLVGWAASRRRKVGV